MARFPFQNIDFRFPLVDTETGRVTEYFQRQLFMQSENGEELDGDVTVLAEAVAAINGTVFTAGTGLTGGGTLGSDDPITFSLDASIDDLTDVDTSSTPPTDGQALIWDNANSVWIPGDVASGGGGGGGGGWTDIPLTNWNFATGDGTGWTVSAGSFTYNVDSGSPTGGGYKADAGAASVSQMYQNVDLSSYSSQIAAGALFIRQDLFWGKGFSDEDNTYGLMIFRDSGGTEIARSYMPTNYIRRNIGVNHGVNSNILMVPLGTDNVDVYAICDRDAGTNCDTYINGVKVAVQDSGSGVTVTTHTVATAGDDFIDVDLSGWKVAKITVRGQFTTNPSNINARLSDDGGVSFYSGASDYKHRTSNSASAISMIGDTPGTNREFILDFTLAGLNETRRFSMTGTGMVVDGGGALTSYLIAGYPNSIGAAAMDYIRIYSAAAEQMDDVEVYVQGIVPA